MLLRRAGPTSKIVRLASGKILDLPRKVAEQPSEAFRSILEITLEVGRYDTEEMPTPAGPMIRLDCLLSHCSIRVCKCTVSGGTPLLQRIINVKQCHILIVHHRKHHSRERTGLTYSFTELPELAGLI